MLNRTKMFTFLFGLVVGTFLFLGNANAQVAISEPGGHPVCDDPAHGCTGEFVDCSCEDRCFFGVGDQDSTPSACAGASQGYLDCVQNVSFSCMVFQGAEFGNCVRNGSASCSEQLNTCVGNCLPQ